MPFFTPSDQHSYEVIKDSVTQNDLNLDTNPFKREIEDQAYEVGFLSKNSDVVVHVPVLSNQLEKRKVHLSVVLSLILGKTCSLPHGEHNYMSDLSEEKVLGDCIGLSDLDGPILKALSYMVACDGSLREKRRACGAAFCLLHKGLEDYLKKNNMKKLAGLCSSLKKNERYGNYILSVRSLCEKVGKEFFKIKRWWEIGSDDYYLPVTKGCIKELPQKN